jgi:hypothetical protein
MTTLLYETIRQFAGSGNHAPLPLGIEAEQEDFPAGLVVALNPSGRTRRDLARQGYISFRDFVALPSLNSPRWLFPLGNGRSALAGLEIYKPYAKSARVLKGLLTALVAARFQRFVGRRVLIGSRGASPLEALVREVTGECQPAFALSMSTEKRFRKLTVQVMRPNGEILGYIKLPLTAAAVQRVQHEAETLKRLWSFPALRPHIPQVLHSGKWGDGYILFQSSGPRAPGPVEFNRQCEEFLERLSAVQKTEKPAKALWEEVAARWRKLEPSLPSGWRALGQAALAKAKRELEGVMILCGVAHGDFAPWNTRLGDHGLYVFDWESACWEAPTSWDVFHFRTQVAALLNVRNSLQTSPDDRPGERVSFLLYLLNSACQLFGEESPAQSVGLECRRQLLAKQLGGC